MRELFEVAELVRVAIEDERTGVVFYDALAKIAGDQGLKKTLAALSEQEKFHQRRFEQMLASMGNYQPKEEYPGEYITYLRALTDGRAFPDEATAIRAADNCRDDRSAIALALQYERDTLMLMNEMRGLVPSQDKPIVDELAREEQTHIVVLTAAMQKLA